MLFYSSKKPTQLTVINLNNKQDAMKKQLAQAKQAEHKGLCRFGDKFKKAKSKSKKERKDLNQHNDDGSNMVYVLDFQGDIKASAVDRLREEISTIISYANAGDEVILRLESAGGQVHSYGLAAAQLERLKEAGIYLTVCVDKVAASGGYMMACVADKVIATPFAVVGSIGVVSQMPNFHEWLKKHDIDVELFTAGEYKRTVTMFGENSDEDRAKYQSELERIHTLFQQHVKSHRPNLDLNQVATGEFWLGQDAKALHLVDELGTSDAYILQKMTTQTVLSLHSHQKLTVMEKLGLQQAGGDVMHGLVQFAKERLGMEQLLQRLP